MLDLWQEIYSTIKRNKLRTLLIGFMVTWGIFMPIVLLGVGNRLIHAFEQNAPERALNSIRLGGDWTTKSYAGLKGGRHIRMEDEDPDATKKYFPDNITTAGAILQQGDVNTNSGQECINISLTGVHPNHVWPEAIEATAGRFINQNDVKERRKVAIPHKKSAEILSKKSHAESIGQLANIGGVVYRVIGLYEDQGNQSSVASIPFSTLQTIYNKGNKFNNTTFTTENLTGEGTNKIFEKEYRKVITADHRFDLEGESTIWVWNRFTQYVQAQNVAGLLRIAIWVIGPFTLLSSIVGMSDIMLITAKEYIREFGIHKAPGAKPSSILQLITVGSVIITTFLGYIGMVVGIETIERVNSTFGNQTVNVGMFQARMFSDPTVDIDIVIQATLTLITVDTFVGFFPIEKAVSIGPVEVLRSDWQIALYD